MILASSSGEALWKTQPGYNNEKQINILYHLHTGNHFKVLANN
tara:strand:- start:145 stop:273 length:129 start_codon:yes stop_codon:yes gene_type:complete